MIRLLRILVVGAAWASPSDQFGDIAIGQHLSVDKWKRSSAGQPFRPAEMYGIKGAITPGLCNGEVAWIVFRALFLDATANVPEPTTTTPTPGPDGLAAVRTVSKGLMMDGWKVVAEDAPDRTKKTVIFGRGVTHRGVTYSCSETPNVSGSMLCQLVVAFGAEHQQCAKALAPQ